MRTGAGTCVRMCPPRKGCVIWRESFFQASRNYMVAYAGVGAKLAEQPVITEGQKALVQLEPSSAAQGPL